MTEKDILTLEKRKNEVFSQIPPEHWNYFNKRSLENFIFNLSRIKGRSEKSEIYKVLSEYIEVIIPTYVDELPTTELRKQLFEIYLNKVAHKFMIRLGFIPVITPSLFLFICAISGALLSFTYYFAPSVCWILLIVFMILGLFFIYKISKKEVFGLKY